MIVGFDGDGPDIFAQQYEFAMQAAIPILTLGALVAPPATPLHRRLRSEGRLADDDTETQVTPWGTNIIPKGMSRELLLRGIQTLVDRLYQPAAFAERTLAFIDRFGTHADDGRTRSEPYGLHTGRPVEKNALSVIRKVFSLGPEESRMMWAIFGALSEKPQCIEPVAFALLQYAQIRFMCERAGLEPIHLKSRLPPLAQLAALRSLARLLSPGFAYTRSRVGRRARSDGAAP